MNWNFTLKKCFRRLYLLLLAFFFFVYVDSRAQVSTVHATQLQSQETIRDEMPDNRTEQQFPSTVPAGTASNADHLNMVLSGGLAGAMANQGGTLARSRGEGSGTVPLSTRATLSGCGKVNLRDAILNLDTSGETTYKFYNSINDLITAEVTAGGVYHIMAENPDYLFTNSRQVMVTVNPVPTLQLTQTSYTVNVGDSVTLTATSDATVTWYNHSGRPLTSNVAGPFTTAGNYTFRVLAYNGICSSRRPVTITVRETSPQASLTGILINSGNNTTICSSEGPVTLLTAQLNSTPAVTNPVYHWYRYDGTNQTLIDGQSTSILALTGLTPGTHTYYVGVSSDQFSETLPAERSSVTFTILPASTAADITISDVTCLPSRTPVTVQPTSTLTNPVFSWYFTDDTTQPITNGTVVDVTYSIAANGALTITGLPAANYSYIYYVGVASDNTCVNLPRTLKAVSISMSTESAPTTNISFHQVFCKENNPTIASIQVNESGVIWYDAPIGGNAVAPDTALVHDRTYYGALTNAASGCQSSVRLAVTVQVNDAATPTTTNASQKFCKVNNPTIASIEVNETGVIWYDAATGGNVIAPATALVTGTYYGALTNAASGCKSSVRLAVAVQVNDAATPTTDTASQKFCKVNNPTIASIEVNETGVIWYDAPTGGNVVAPATALVTGTYYGALTNAASGCQSSRLAVAVQVIDAPKPTTDNTSQKFCKVNNPTIASIQVNETGVIWYDAATGGNVVAPATALVTGTYYGALTAAASDCQSSARLAVAVQVIDAAKPTTTNASQKFCKVNNPTIASIQVNETSVTWYDAATGGNVVAPATVLVTGTYYGALTAAASDCQSSARLAVAVQVIDAAKPTTTNASQKFCKVNNPTIASIQVNETGVIWYDAATGGNVVAPATALVTGTYYGALTAAASDCQSSARLAVAVQVIDAAKPTTTNASQKFCKVNNPTIASIQVNETGVIWYDAATGGNVVAPATALVTGTYYGALTAAASDCQSSARLAVAVQVIDAAKPTTTNASQKFCKVNNPTIASIQVNETGVIWYDAATGGNVVAPATALVTGTYYGALTAAASDCQSSARLAVAVQVIDAAKPTTTNASQKFCKVNNPTIASIQVNETGVIWYDAATGGNVVAPATALVTGTYYGALTAAASDCQSSARLAVAVQVIDTPAPTTNNTSQEFSQSTNPTIASIQVNESGVIWYNAATGGTVVTPTTPLVTGTYYGVLTDAASGCQSSVRLAVAVQVIDAPTPTSEGATQYFCKSANPTVASIQVNETGVIWYDAATGGNVVAPATALVTGTYYGALTTAASGHQSSVRLAVAVQVNDAPTPTTNDTSQEFCQSTNPTVASIQVNESGVIWYDAATGGNVVAPATALVTGTYYGALTTAASDCQSSVRLAVAVQIFSGTPATITGGSPTACIQDQVTYTANTGMTNYVWTVSSGGQVVSGGTTADNTITVLWTQTGANTVKVSYSDANGCSTSNTASVNLDVTNCSDITITKTVDSPTPLIDDNVVFTITVTNIGQAQFQNIVVNEALPSGYAFVSMVASVGTYNNNTGIWTIPTLNANEVATLQLTVTVLSSGDYLNTATIASSVPVDSDVNNNTASASVDPKCLVVYNEFTPNEDGSNDVFTIKCVEHYPNNTLEVYNRYGNLVYKTRNYQNDWKGISNVGGTFGGTVLPTGTYYYVFDTGDNTSTVKTGWVYIMR